MYTKKIIDGYFERTVTYDRRLKYCPYGSAGVMVCHNGIHLYSYTTRVCTITGDGWLTCTGTYSATTRKHIGAFLKEYAPKLSYYDAKHCYENGEAINIHTGEIISITNN